MPITVNVEEKNPEIWKVLVTEKYAGVEVDAKLSTTTGILGKVPVLETSEGTISEANAIARYLARLSKNHLYGKTDFEASQVDQYIDFSTNYIELPGAVWVYPILGQINNNAAATAKAQADIKKSLEYLNGRLATKTFLVGERVTIADIIVAMSLYYLFQKVLDVNFRKPYTNVVRWYTTVVNQTQVKDVIGEVKLSEKAEVASGAPIKVAEKKKEEKPKKEEKKPEKKAEKKPEPKEEEEEDEKFEEEEAKGTNPLDLLPKPTMVFDEWKRQYSNNDTKPVAMPWLWKNFDKNGYSIWKCDYKYNDECQKVFMTCNLIGGWIQRLDKLRKYGFGSICIFGEEPNLQVSGVWIFRGQDIPAEMTFTDDCEHYTWTKLNPDDEATREMVGDYFAWEGNFGGQKNFNQGKIFK